MNSVSKEQMVSSEGSWAASADERLKELGIKLPGAAGAVRHLYGSGADGQSTFSEWDASHGKPPGEIHRPSRLFARLSGHYHLVAPDYPGFRHSKADGIAALTSEFIKA